MATLPSPPGDLPPEQLFLGHLELIKRLIAFACRRYRLTQDKAEEFSSRVMVKLIENDYGVLRQFGGKCRLQTYLGTVIQRQMLDFLDHIWGKWRPSEEAKRMEPDALLLDRLLHRDGYTFDQAVEILKSQGVALSREDLERIAARLPARVQRQTEGEEGLRAVPSKEPAPDDRIEEQERTALRRRAAAALHRALDSIPAEDKLLVQMSMEHKVSDISRAQKMEQKGLYRRLKKILAELRKAMEREGIRKKDIDFILGKLEP